MDHLAIAAGCLGATALAILASLVTFVRGSSQGARNNIPSVYFEYKSMIRAIARWQTRQNPTRSRVNMMQSACGR